jgi:O-antigen ligase
VLKHSGEVLLGCFAVGAVFAFCWATLKYDVEPYQLLLGLMATTAAIVLMRKSPAALIAALLYVGNLKTTAAEGLSLRDPTFIVLVLCSGGVLIESLLLFSRGKRSSLAGMFAGQGLGVLLFVLFLLMIAVSQLYTTAPVSGLMKLERIAVFATFAFFAPFILFQGPKDLKQFLATCVVLSLALSIRDLADLFHPTAAVLAGNEDITRIGDGELIGTAIVILIYYRHFALRRSLQVACLGLLAIGLAASAARTAALALLVTLAVASIFAPSLSRPLLTKKILLGGLVVVVAVAAILLIGQLPAAKAKVAYKENELGYLMKGSFVPGGTAEQRIHFYRQSLVAITERPWLGWGVGGWGAFFLGMDKAEMPHNFVLESAVEQGLIGCTSLLAFLIAVASALGKVVRGWSGPHYAFLLPAALLPVLTGSVSGGLDNRLLWFWCGTIFAVSRMIHEQHPQFHGYAGGRAYRTSASGRAFVTPP